MKLKVLRGTTSKLLRVFIQDSSKTDGSGLTALTYNASGLTWYYCREGDSSTTAVTPVTATLGTYTSSGFIAVDGTNMPGVYEIGIPNAALSSGNSVVMMLRGAANMVPVLIEIELDAVNYQSATNFGLSALPTANPGAANGLFVAGTNAATTVSTAFTTTFTGNLTGSVASVTGNVTVGGYASGQDPGTYILVTPANKLYTDSSNRVDLGKILGTASAGTAGKVALDLTQSIPTSNTAQTVGDALNAARAQGFGKWVLSGTTLTLYASDGTTAVRTFTLDSARRRPRGHDGLDRHAGPGCRPPGHAGLVHGHFVPKPDQPGDGRPTDPPSGSCGGRACRIDLALRWAQDQWASRGEPLGDGEAVRRAGFWWIGESGFVGTGSRMRRRRAGWLRAASAAVTILACGGLALGGWQSARRVSATICTRTRDRETPSTTRPAWRRSRGGAGPARHSMPRPLQAGRAGLRSLHRPGRGEHRRGGGADPRCRRSRRDGVPAPPLGLRAFPIAGGKVRLEWTHPGGPPSRQPLGFRVYVGTGPVADYSLPVLTVDWSTPDSAASRPSSPAWAAGPLARLEFAATTRSPRSRTPPS